MSKRKRKVAFPPDKGFRLSPYGFPGHQDDAGSSITLPLKCPNKKCGEDLGYGIQNHGRRELRTVAVLVIRDNKVWGWRCPECDEQWEIGSGMDALASAERWKRPGTWHEAQFD